MQPSQDSEMLNCQMAKEKFKSLLIQTSKAFFMNVYLDTVGCRLNQSEIENYARQIRGAGHNLVSSLEQADLMALNSCSVTAPAASDSRQKIRQANRAGVDQIVVTGCWATLEPEKAAAMLGVTRVVPNSRKDNLMRDLLEIDPNKIDLQHIERQPIPGPRLRTRAFIKAQDGCDNHCTFCVTTIARGASRSRPPTEVIADINAALNGGALEIVLTGVHLGSWGYDFEQPDQLRSLVEQILDATDTPRLRLSSLEPWDLDEDFFSLWQDPRLCRHLHLPLQSGSASTLRRMARKTTPHDYSKLIEAARAAIPNVAITTDIITGFPGETEQEFSESLVFLEEMQFSSAHIFTYSARPGTAAASMANQVHNAARKERSAILREVVKTAKEKYQVSFLGQKLPVLWERAERLEDDLWKLNGLTDNYLRVKTQSNQPIWNQITLTKLTSLEDNLLVGAIS
ncbi:MAG: MiaB/RimO family radical SAM methylthiotransferase [Chloroflexi bacterium]|nr:MiaB/RimO family radical SAM methylthiotransferase [Chloroflexota bacterium]